VPDAVVSSSARRYAEAAFAVARDAGALDTWVAAIDDLAVLFTNADLRAVLASPTVETTVKRDILERLVPDLPLMVRNFLAILANRERLAQIPHIAQAFRERVNRERGVLTAEVTTAVPLDPESERTVMQRLGTFLNHDPDRLAISTRVDPDIIGGVVARIGDTLIDDSVRGRLDRLRRALAADGR
jgi:F-type H+-transporting ATPase subunit delta